MNRLSTIMILLLSTFVASSCNNTSSSDGEPTETKLYPIAVNPEHPNKIFLKLMDRTEGDTSISWMVKGLYHGDTVGFVIEVDKNIPAGITHDGYVDEQAGFNKGWIKFKKSGTESDRFAAALAELWQVDDIGGMTAETIQPLVFSSNKTAVDHSKPSTNSFKLFFNEDAPIPGEVFFTFDTYTRSIEFQEKDERYRATIVRSFAE